MTATVQTGVHDGSHAGNSFKKLCRHHCHLVPRSASVADALLTVSDTVQSVTHDDQHDDRDGRRHAGKSFKRLCDQHAHGDAHRAHGRKHQLRAREAG